MKQFSVSSIIVWLAVLGAFAADTRAAPPKRVSGLIADDAKWSGAIWIVDRTQIVGATVTVEPGASIEFAAPDKGPTPTLTVGSETKPGKLVLAGSPNLPIIVRSRPDAGRGSIALRPGPRSALQWTWVVFENLGALSTAPPDQAGHRPLPLPALNVFAEPLGAEIVLTNCTFRHCFRVFLRGSDRTKGRIADCRFENGEERMDLELAGAGAAFVVNANRFNGVVNVSNASMDFRENILIGPRTALSVDAPAKPPTRIMGNYIHNATDADDGSYALKCADPDAEIRDNVLRGGTYVVLQGSRRMSGNVLIGAPRLSSKLKRDARTHYLVAEIPARTVFDQNFLIGPSYALLATQAARNSGPDAHAAEPVADLTIRRNVFDGLDRTSQAIRFNVLAREPVHAAITENLFLRVPTLVLDESRRPGVVALADRNIVAPRPARPWEGVVIEGKKPGDPGFGASDRTVDSISQLALSALPSGSFDDWDDQVLAARTTIRKVRDRVVAAYRPRTASAP